MATISGKYADFTGEGVLGLTDEDILEFSRFPVPEGTTEDQRKVMHDYMGQFKPDEIKRLCDLFQNQLSLVRGILEIMRHGYNRIRTEGRSITISYEGPAEPVAPQP